MNAPQPEYAAEPEWEREHSIEVSRVEKDLRAALDRAAVALADVGSALRRLTGDAWHVEYAEGINGRDAVHETEQAERSVRNVARIVRHLSPEGDR